MISCRGRGRANYYSPYWSNNLIFRLSCTPSSWFCIYECTIYILYVLCIWYVCCDGYGVTLFVWIFYELLFIFNVNIPIRILKTVLRYSSIIYIKTICSCSFNSLHVWWHIDHRHVWWHIEHRHVWWHIEHRHVWWHIDHRHVWWHIDHRHVWWH